MADNTKIAEDSAMSAEQNPNHDATNVETADDQEPHVSETVRDETKDRCDADGGVPDPELKFDSSIKDTLALHSPSPGDRVTPGDSCAIEEDESLVKQDDADCQITVDPGECDNDILQTSMSPNRGDQQSLDVPDEQALPASSERSAPSPEDVKRVDSPDVCQVNEAGVSTEDTTISPVVQLNEESVEADHVQDDPAQVTNDEVANAVDEKEPEACNSVAEDKVDGDSPMEVDQADTETEKMDVAEILKDIDELSGPAAGALPLALGDEAMEIEGTPENIANVAVADGSASQDQGGVAIVEEESGEAQDEETNLPLESAPENVDDANNDNSLPSNAEDGLDEVDSTCLKDDTCAETNVSQERAHSNSEQPGGAPIVVEDNAEDVSADGRGDSSSGDKNEIQASSEERDEKVGEYELTENRYFSEDSNSRPASRVSEKDTNATKAADQSKQDSIDAESSGVQGEGADDTALTISSVVGGTDASQLSENENVQTENLNKTSADTPHNGNEEAGKVEESKDESPTKDDDSTKEDVKPAIQPKTDKDTSSESDQKSAKSKLQCIVCKKVGKCKYNIVRNGDTKHLCDDSCFQVFRANPTNYLRGDKKNGAPQGPQAAKNCQKCSNPIPPTNTGKYAVKIARVLRHFCQETCMADFQKEECIGKPCHYCKGSVSKSGVIVAIVEEAGLPASRAFCTHQCHKSAVDALDDSEDVEIVGQSNVPPSNLGSSKCSVCNKVASIKHEVTYNQKKHKLCGDPCFAAFRYANKLSMNTCDNCGAVCSPDTPNVFLLQFEGKGKKFCKKSCQTTFRQKNNRIIPCGWCGAKKSNFEMVERLDTNNKCQLFCTLNCLSLYRVNLQATSNQSINCDQCKKAVPAQYHLTMSDASVRNFCSYNCVMAFQGQFTGAQKPGGSKQATPTHQQRNMATRTVPSSHPVSPGTRQSARVSARNTVMQSQATVNQSNLPMISNVMSLAPQAGGQAKGTPVRTQVQQKKQQAHAAQQTRIIVKPPPPKELKNKAVLCKPFQQTKATSCRPLMQSKECQTDEYESSKQVLIPVPVPYYVPVPMKMYTTPTPYPVPIPVPIPIPMFIPTTRKSADGILKQIKKIAESTPADPFEAELLMMAEAVAGAEKPTSDTSDDEDNVPGIDENEEPTPEPVAEPNIPVGEDLLQMAFRVASMPSEPVLDLEDTLESNPINPADVPQPVFSTIDQDSDIIQAAAAETQAASRNRGRRRVRGRGGNRPAKRAKVESDPPPREPTPPLQPPPDANMVLKYTYGVNAWKHWVLQKNEQLEKAPGRTRLKKMKTELLQCTADELNYSLCLFVKEVRKPNGEEYAADSIYYLCLGIQQNLYENGRIDNIFTDIYYEKFTECLNEILSRYEVRLNAQGLIVCRIEEEHLWESKQLGAHSPYVLMNTLIYFNTKYFMLRTPEDHLRLSFSHIMKHWKKSNIPGTKTPGRSVYLRYYAPVAGKANEPGNKRKRDDVPVYEQGENVDNPLRCPVKLYEFYLSKCPESIKNRNDVFYLVPERSCVPDSPVWCSTAPLGIESLTKMLNRMRVVREIQEAHLHHQPLY